MSYAHIKKTFFAAGIGIAILAIFALTIVASAASNLERVKKQVPEPARSDAKVARFVVPGAGQSGGSHPGVMPGADFTSPGSAALASGGYVSVTTPWQPPSPSYRISVTLDGMYQFDYAALSAAGLPVDSLDPRTFRMFYMGHELPIRVIGEADGVFNPGDSLIFYARGLDPMFYDGLLPTNKYTGTNIYWLSYGGPAGLRMIAKDGSSSGATPGPFLHREHLETNRFYFSNYPYLPDADHWFDRQLQAVGPAPVAFTYSFIAQNIAPGAGLTGSLTINLQGFTDGAYHLRLYVNSNLVYDDGSAWAGKTSFTASAPVPQAYFVSGSNSLRVEIVNDQPSTVDQVYTNWLEAVYYDTFVAEADSLVFGSDISGTWRFDVSGFSTNDVEVYDITDLLDVQQVLTTTLSGVGPYTASFGDTMAAGRRYLALTPAQHKTPAGIQLVTRPTSAYALSEPLTTTNQVNYIIITHSAFWAQAERLAYHRSQLYAVALVDVQDIYDRFNGGMMSAEAIHDFLAYTYSQWRSPAPRFVVLMGDGSSNMRNYRVVSAPTFIPPYLALVDPDLGETAADNLFVTLVGNDNMPDMALGRMSVNDMAQATAMVDKVIAYETQCQCGEGGDAWNKNTLFVSDNLVGGGGNFYSYSDEIADGYIDPPTNSIKLLPETYTVTKAYMGVNCDVSNPAVADECRAQITQTLNYTGALFLNYIGHAGKPEWAVERLMDETLLTTLTRTACLPVFLPMTCYEGSFQEPGTTAAALAESYTRLPLYGAVASWSPTGSGLVSGHDYLEQGMFRALFHQGVETLGEATLAGKQYLLDNAPPGQYHDLLDTFMIFGDPALRLKIGSACDVPTGLPVVGFAATSQGRAVRLTWTTGTEADILAFNIVRGPASQVAETQMINSTPILATWPGSNQGASYTYVDEHVQAGSAYVYTLDVLKLTGGHTMYGPITVRVNNGHVYLPLFQK